MLSVYNPSFSKTRNNITSRNLNKENVEKIKKEQQIYFLYFSFIMKEFQWVVRPSYKEWFKHWIFLKHIFNRDVLGIYTLCFLRANGPRFKSTTASCLALCWECVGSSEAYGENLVPNELRKTKRHYKSDYETVRRLPFVTALCSSLIFVPWDHSFLWKLNLLYVLPSQTKSQENRKETTADKTSN